MKKLILKGDIFIVLEQLIKKTVKNAESDITELGNGWLKSYGLDYFFDISEKMYIFVPLALNSLNREPY